MSIAQHLRIREIAEWVLDELHTDACESRKSGLRNRSTARGACYDDDGGGREEVAPTVLTLGHLGEDCTAAVYNRHAAPRPTPPPPPHATATLGPPAPAPLDAKWVNLVGLLNSLPPNLTLGLL